ncbi:MAG: hypothetical protein M3445_10020 [Actinomycetota bacterium]|nr:hypothetical protein [Actinomycetota bacterium]
MIAVSASVQTDDAEALVRVMESLGRACAGLALDGLDIHLTALQFDPDVEGEP